jgi:hypothetical protein
MVKRTSLDERDKKINNAVSAFVSNLDTENDTNNDTDSDTKKSKNNLDKSEQNDTNIVSKNRGNIKIGDFKISLEPESTKRIPYELRISTIEMISEVSKITGMSKKNLVDHIMHSVCESIIKKTKK